MLSTGSQPANLREGYGTMCNNPTCHDCNRATFVADYVIQELEWGNDLTGQTIRDAQWAYEGFITDAPLCQQGVPENTVKGGAQ